MSITKESKSKDEDIVKGGDLNRPSILKDGTTRLHDWVSGCVMVI